MTLIAANIHKDGTVWVAADSMSSNSHGDRRLRRDPKIFKKDGYIIGYTSSYRMGQILEHKTEFPKLPQKNVKNLHIVSVIDAISKSLFDNHYTIEKDNRYSGGCFIIAWHSRLYIIESDFQYHRPLLPYCCAGAGEEYGLGAMHAHYVESTPVAMLIRAMQAASDLNCHVAPPYIIMNTDGYKKTYKK